MLNTISRLYEKPIRDRKEKQIAEHGLLFDLRYGFRKGRSTMQALEKARALFEEGRPLWCVLVTIDVRNAFNSADWRIILDKMGDKQNAPYIRKLTAEYPSEREILIEQGHRIKINAGVSQGSVVGSTLWNVLYDGVLNFPLPRRAKTIGFADDLALIVRAKQLMELINKANDSLSRISNWMHEHELKIAPEKCEALFLKKRGNPKDVYFRIGANKIQPTKTR